MTLSVVFYLLFVNCLSISRWELVNDEEKRLAFLFAAVSQVVGRFIRNLVPLPSWSWRWSLFLVLAYVWRFFC